MAHRGKLQYVLIADDQPLFRSGVRTLLAAEMVLEVVGEAATLSETIVKQQQLNPDVTVVSSSLLRGVSAAERERIREWADKGSLLLISDGDADIPTDLWGEMEMPVSIPRSSSPVQIVAAIRRTAWKEEQAEAGMSRTGAGLRALAEAHVEKNSILTSREQEVVRLLAEGRTVRETAAELSLSAKTIDAHKLNVMRKLDIHNREKLIEYAIAHRIVTPASV